MKTVMLLIILQSMSAVAHDFTNCPNFGPFRFTQSGATYVDRANPSLTTWDTKSDVNKISWNIGTDDNKITQTAYIRKNDDGLPTSVTTVIKNSPDSFDVAETQYRYDGAGDCAVNRSVIYNSKDPSTALVTYDRDFCDKIDQIRAQHMLNGLDVDKCDAYTAEMADAVKKYNNNAFSSVSVSDIGSGKDKKISAKAAGLFIDPKAGGQAKVLDVKSSEQLTMLGVECATVRIGFKNQMYGGGYGGGYGLNPFVGGAMQPMGGGYAPSYSNGKTFDPGTAGTISR